MTASRDNIDLDGSIDGLDVEQLLILKLKMSARIPFTLRIF